MDNEIIRWVLSVVIAIFVVTTVSILMLAIATWPQTGLVLVVLFFVVIVSGMIHDILS